MEVLAISWNPMEWKLSAKLATRWELAISPVLPHTLNHGAGPELAAHEFLVW